MTVLLASLVDATVVLALGLALATALRRKSAALRHAILTAAIVCALLMPALEVLLPQLPVLHWTKPTAVESTLVLTGERAPVPAVTSEHNAAPAAPATIAAWATLVAGVWAAGVLVTLGGLLTGLVRLRRLRASCTPVGGPWRALTDELAHQSGIDGPVALLQSHDRSLLVTCGLFRPAIILPAGSGDWTDDRTRIVLRHELAHIKRHDAAIQLAGELLRVMQPFNPLVWLACRRLRQESEYACDDAVLESGVEATDYATHLFDVAARLSGRQPVWASAPAIAHPSTLERRIVAMLQTEKDRQPLNGRGWSIAVVLAAVVSLPLAAIGVAPQQSAALTAVAPTTPPVAAVPAREGAASQQAAITGRIVDQSGGTLPGVTVTVTNRQTNAVLVSITKPTGAFEFSGLPPAEYELMAQLSGFRRLTLPVDISSGTPADLALTLEIGSLTEEITVRCAATSSSILQMFFPTLSAQERPATPIRVGGDVKVPRKTRDVAPTCPPGGVTGNVIVILEGHIGVDGLVTDITPMNQNAPAEFYGSAMEAIEQWEFTPTLLNGVPVEVTITVTVNFVGS